MQPPGADNSPPQDVAGAFWRGWQRWYRLGGTATRLEFWAFVPLTWVIFPVLGFLSGAWFIDESGILRWIAGFGLTVYALFAAVATATLSVRRVRAATSLGRFAAVGFVSPFIVLGIAACPPYDRRRLSSLGVGYWDVWRKTGDFLGVAPRVEFWQFTLINLVLVIAAMVAGALVLATSLESTDDFDDALGPLAAFLGIQTGVGLTAAVAWIPLFVRRVRDATGNGAIALLALLGFVPILGQIAAVVLFVICLLPSTDQPAPPDGVGDGRPDDGRGADADDAAYDPDDPWSSDDDSPRS